MKVIIEVNSFAAVKAAQNIVLEWKEEHEGYYGSPCGYRRILKGLEWAECGYTSASVPVPDACLVTTTGSRWLTCRGNDHRISITGETVTLAYDGRRHGMRQEFRELLERYWGVGEVNAHYQTEEPGWKPWETKDTHKEIA